MRADDLLLANLAVQKGWIAEGVSRKCLEDADRLLALGLDKAVDEVLVEKGHLSAEQARELRGELGLSVVVPRVGDYTLLRRVGIGGAGLVFEARHVRLQQRVALKVLLPKFAQDPRITARFMREARLLASFSHPHLVHAIDAGQDGGSWYLAMELVEGENLLQRILRVGPLSLLDSLPIVEAVVSALGALDEKGLVHRDVKPANILLEADGGVKLADFGLLAETEVKAGRGGWAGPSCGTPPYMAPEHILGRAAGGFRSDLYSLGATWYHTLTGQPPFLGPTSRAILRAHVSTPLPSIRARRPDLPIELEETLGRWLAKRPEDRPASASQALEDLVRLRQALSRRGSIPWRGWRLGAPARAGALLVAVTLAATTLLIWVLGRQERRTNELVGPSDGLVGARAEPGAGAAATAPTATPPPVEGLPPTEPQAMPDSLPDAPSEMAAVASSQEPPRRGEPAPLAAPPPAASPPATPGRIEAAPLPEGGPLPAARPWVDVFPDRWTLVGLPQWLEGPGFRTLARASDRLAPLARGWRARFVGIEPTLAPSPEGVWIYAFEDESELLDLRLRPGAWRLASAGLTRTEGDSTDLLAARVWLAPPVSMRVEWSGAGGVALGLGSAWLREEADGWRVGDRAAATEALGRIRPGASTVRELTLRLEADRAEWVVEGKTTSAGLPATPWGRPQLMVSGKPALRTLRLAGKLDPDWLAARLEASSEPEAGRPR